MCVPTLAVRSFGSPVLFGGPIFDGFNEPREPAICLMAIDDAVVNGKRHKGFWANLNRVVSVNFNDRYTLFQFADA